MSERNNQKTNPNQPMIYQIRIKGHLGSQWKDWFDGMTMTLEENGETVLSGPVADQPALYGLLKKVRDLGMNLVAVNHIDSDQGGALEIKGEENGSIENFEQLIYKRRKEMDSIKKTARFAGVLYLIITVFAIIAHQYIPNTLIVAGDPQTTADNIAASETLFRVGGVGSELVILLSEIILSIVLYVLLKPVNKTLSLMAAVSRLAMTTIHGINLINYYFVLLLVTGTGYMTAFGSDQSQALVSLFLDAHHYGFTIGIAFLTIHVFILGYLILKSEYFPSILGVLFLLAGVGYLVDSFALLLSSSYHTTPVFLAIPIAVAEIAFPLWLLIKGVNVDGWQKLAPEPA